MPTSLDDLVVLYLHALSLVYFVLPVDPASSCLTLSLSPLGVLSATLRERKKHAQFWETKIFTFSEDTFELYYEIDAFLT